jgi:hypothetical protein
MCGVHHICLGQEKNGDNKYNILTETPEKRDHFRGPGIDGTTVTKCNSNK